MLGRRQFLKLLGGLVGPDLLRGMPVRFVQNERFVSTDLGLTFCKPHGWVFISPEQLALETADIGSAHDRLDLDPSVMNISKEPWSTTPKRFTPGINVWSYSNKMFHDLDHMVQWTRAGHAMYSDFKITKDVCAITLAGCPAFDFVAEFNFDTLGFDRPVPVRDRFICVAQGNRFLLITVCDSPQTGKDEGPAFSSFLQSLVIAEPADTSPHKG